MLFCPETISVNIMNEDSDVYIGKLAPTNAERRTVSEWVRQNGKRTYNKFTTRAGLIGDYDYAFLFKPKIPFATKGTNQTAFFGLNSNMPIVLGFLLGLQHSLAMLAGIVTPPIIIAGTAGFSAADTQYLVSASLIASAILSFIQISRFHIWRTKYYVGTGLLSVVGTSFATITIVSAAFPQMYRNGFCPTADDGTPLPCPDGYGAILGTSCVCGLVEILLSSPPPKVLQRMFPPIVTGPVVLLIGASLIQSGFMDFVGGSGSCSARPSNGMYSLCPDTSAPHALQWGSASFIGLGFSVFVSIVIFEKWGAPIMKSTSVVLGLIVGCIIAAACGYFDRSGIDAAPTATFIWTTTFKLRVYGPIVLPMIAVYITVAMEAIGDITATSDVSRQDVEGPVYESRTQGGVFADGLSGILAGLMTMTPMSIFAQNNGVIALTNCANRIAGYWCCLFLLIMGVFAKFAAAIIAIPSSVLGGMTTFLFTSVAVSGIRIISLIKFTSRDRFILTCSLMFGFGSLLVPNWFSYFFTYQSTNDALTGFLDAIEIVMETGFAIGRIIGVIMNFLLPETEDAVEQDRLARVEIHQAQIVQKMKRSKSLVSLYLSHFSCFIWFREVEPLNKLLLEFFR